MGSYRPGVNAINPVDTSNADMGGGGKKRTGHMNHADIRNARRPKVSGGMQLHLNASFVIETDGAASSARLFGICEALGGRELSIRTCIENCAPVRAHHLTEEVLSCGRIANEPAASHLPKGTNVCNLTH